MSAFADVKTYFTSTQLPSCKTWILSGQSTGSVLSALCNVTEFTQVTSILSCIGHKNENLIDLYMIDIFMVRVGKWKLCMLKQCCCWDVELKLLYHCVRHRHCNDSRILWNSQKNGSPPSLPRLPNIIRPLSRFHSVSRPLSLFLSFLLSDLSVTSYHLLSQTYRHSHL